MDKKKILVTGAVGFIGSNFIRKSFFDKRPYTFASIDKVTRPLLLRTIYGNRNHEFYLGDIKDAQLIENIFTIEQPDLVLHFAAETHVDHSIRDSQPFIQTNVLGTQTLVDACVRHKLRLIHISTDEVYGSLNSESDEPWTEESPMQPRNPYAASKASAEMLVRAASITHGLNYNIVRCSNNYGPRQTGEKFIPSVIRSILKSEPVKIYGDGSQVRDWLHVWDNCEALFRVIEDAAPNETYNITANHEFTNLEVANIICSKLEKGHDLIQHVKDRPGHDFRYAMDSSKIKKLGWNPSMKFKSAIGQVVEWYVLNKYYLET